MPVTRSRTSSEQSAPEVVSEDLKHVEAEDKDLSLTSQKLEVNVETKNVNQVEEVNNSANNNNNSNNNNTNNNEASSEVTTPAAATETPAAEENNGNTNVAEETSEKAENGVSQENHDRLDAKRKSEVGLSETPDSTELMTKKAKVDEETPKVSETEEATPTNPVEASA